MTSPKLTNFLKTLDTMKQDLTCGVCSQLCKNAVTLSKCFHLICMEHFEGLEYCPTCNAALDGCKTYIDKDLADTISSTKELVDMFKSYQKQQHDILKPHEVSTIAIEKVKDDPPTKIRRSAKKKEMKANTETTQTTMKSNERSKEAPIVEKKQETKKKASKASLENPNTTITSNMSSSKLNKTLEKRNVKGETILHVACRLGKLDKVIELLGQGANPNTKDNAGWTPLHEAVQNNRLDLVRVLLQHNALINVPGQSNETPLHEAIRYGHKDIVKELVVNGADVQIRNIKGESPLELAKGDMKEALDTASENIVQTQSMNITHISAMHSELDFDDVRVYCVSLYRTVQNKLKKLVKHHSNLHIEAKFTKNVTHLIVDTEEDLICTATLDILQAITNNLWVLSSDWVTKSTEDRLEPFETYEVIGVGKDTYNGPKNARYNKYKQLPGLFNGCHFYLHNFNMKYEISKQIVLNKAVLSKLITDAGGIVLRRVPNPECIPDSEKLVPYHARKDGPLVDCSHYIIFKDLYEPRYNMKHLKALPVGWLIECIEKYELCNP